MDKKGKIRIECDCGSVMKERKVLLDGGIESETLECPNCSYRVLTRDQALKYFNLRQMKEDLEAERKIIRIGNSVGITLPEKISKYGIKVGDKVRLEAIDEKSFKISII